MQAALQRAAKTSARYARTLAKRLAETFPRVARLQALRAERYQ